MKAKYFKKIRSQVKWYKVSYRDDLFSDFIDEKTIYYTVKFIDYNIKKIPNVIVYVNELFKKYDYSPNKSEKSVEDVIEQVTFQCIAVL